MEGALYTARKLHVEFFLILAMDGDGKDWLLGPCWGHPETPEDTERGNLLYSHSTKT